VAKTGKKRMVREREPAERASAPRAAARPEAPEGRESRGSRRRTVAAVAGFLAVFLILAWGVLCLRAARHYRAGLEADRAGHAPEAARELESAVGCCAPLNPYCGAAAERLLDLARRTAGTDPVLGEEIRDRLMRALRSTRWLFQPHAGLLASAESYAPRSPAAPRDPHELRFLTALLCLLGGMGIWWTRHPLWLRAVVGAVGLSGWAGLLYLC